MHTSTTVAAISLLAPLVAAHSEGFKWPIPKVFGAGNILPRAAGPVPMPKPRPASRSLLERTSLVPRDEPTTCGPGIGSCAADMCCSPAGYCGTTEAYCAAPDCQINYGPACDANVASPGTNTSTVARPQLGSVPYGGAGIYSCTVPGTVAITFDDGPYIYTSHVLDLFDQYNAKATFFITANNLGKGPIDDPQYPWSDIIKRMDASGHQIASHTWSHQDLSAITASQREEQIYNLESATRNILGKFPTYMRPPYSSCNSDCSTFLGNAGYHIIYFDQDTSDYLFNTPSQIQTSKDYVSGNLTLKGDPMVDDWLAIGHDIQDQTANNLTEFMLQAYTAKGFKLVTVGECLGDPVSNWYRTAGGAGTYNITNATSTASQPLPTPSGVTTDGTCGSGNSLTCLGAGFGNCCSVSGWCGSGSTYCGTGCQLGYGNCGSNGANNATWGIGANATVAAAAALPSATGLSVDGTCGSNNGLTCTGAGFGPCCSSAGWCGSTNGHCQAGCQAGFGNCGIQNTTLVSTSTSTSTSSVSSSASSTSSMPLPTISGVSSDGTCGSNNGLTCVSSGFGNCCSPAGWCGSTTAYCGTGCQYGYGSCGSNAVASVSTTASSAASAAPASPAPATANLTLSTDGTCGSSSQQTCLGYSSGQCCSQYGWCGNTEGHCNTGCQGGFGKCAGDVFAASSIVSQVLTWSGMSSSTQASSSLTSAAASSLVTSSAASTAPAAQTSASPAAAKASSAANAVSLAAPVESKKQSSSIPASSSLPASSSIKPSPSSAKPSASPSPSVSSDRTCGSTVNQTCTGSVFGSCCIQFSSVTTGYCYSGDICNMLTDWCQKKYGKC